MAIGIKLTNCSGVVIRGGVISGCETAIDADGVQNFDAKGLEIRSEAPAKTRRRGILSGAANLATLGTFAKDLF